MSHKKISKYRVTLEKVQYIEMKEEAEILDIIEFNNWPHLIVLEELKSKTTKRIIKMYNIDKVFPSIIEEYIGTHIFQNLSKEICIFFDGGEV